MKLVQTLPLPPPFLRIPFLLFLLYYISSTSALWPIPAQYESGNSVLWLDFTVKITHSTALVVCLPIPNRKPLLRESKSNVRAENQ